MFRRTRLWNWLLRRVAALRTWAMRPARAMRTTLGAAAPGRTVNLEVDILAKYVEKLSAR